jgi:hypothetical protein
LDRGFSIPSPALLGRISAGYVKTIERFASKQRIPVVHFKRGESKELVARRYTQRAERAGRFGGGHGRGRVGEDLGLAGVPPRRFGRPPSLLSLSEWSGVWAVTSDPVGPSDWRRADSPLRERVLRFEAIVHNTKQLGCGRTLDRFGEIISRLTAMVERFTSMLDCVEIGFLPDGTLDGYTTRQGAYDLRKLRGKQLVTKPGRTRRYHVPEAAARTITALLTVGDKVIAPLIAGIRTPRRGRPPKHWTQIDRDYETSGSACRPGSVTSAPPSMPPQRQHLVDDLAASR